MVFWLAFLQIGRQHARKIAPFAVSDFGRAAAEFALESAAKLSAIGEAALLGDFKYPALVAWISQGRMRIQEAPVLNIVFNAAKRLKQPVEPRARNSKFAAQQAGSQSRIE